MSNSSSEGHNSENDGWLGELTANTGSESLRINSTVHSRNLLNKNPAAYPEITGSKLIN